MKPELHLYSKHAKTQWRKETSDQFPLWISMQKYSIKFLQTESKNTSWSRSSLHPCDAGIVKYTEIHQLNLLDKQTQRQKPHHHLLRWGESIYKTQHRFMIKVLERLGIQGPYLNKIKAIYSKPIANFKIKCRNTWSNPTKIRDKTRIPTFPISIEYSTYSLSQSN